MFHFSPNQRWVYTVWGKTVKKNPKKGLLFTLRDGSRTNSILVIIKKKAKGDECGHKPNVMTEDVLITSMCYHLLKVPSVHSWDSIHQCPGLEEAFKRTRLEPAKHNP